MIKMKHSKSHQEPFMPSMRKHDYHLVASSWAIEIDFKICTAERNSKIKALEKKKKVIGSQETVWLLHETVRVKDCLVYTRVQCFLVQRIGSLNGHDSKSKHTKPLYSLKY